MYVRTNNGLGAVCLTDLTNDPVTGLPGYCPLQSTGGLNPGDPSLQIGAGSSGGSIDTSAGSGNTFSQDITAFDTSAANTLQNLVNALNPSQWAIFQAGTPAASSSSFLSNINWTGALIGVSVLFLVMAIAPRGRR